MKKILFILVLLSSFNSSACVNGKSEDGIVPRNNLKIPEIIGLQTGISRKTFNSIIKRVYKEYAPVVEALEGRLVIKKNWRDDTVNAFAFKKGKKRVVEMFGGFARHHLVTADSFMMVACHEIGHHVGGEPMIHGMRELWASNEGQSDYFASTKCMRKLLVSENNEMIMRKVDVPEIVKNKCDLSFNDKNEKSLCQRISMAGLSLASVFRDIRKSDPIDFSTPDPDVIWRTWFLHPVPQCRLDTYFSGAVCSVSHDIELSYDDENVGFCTRTNGDQEGNRPLCWWNPTNF